MKPAMLQVKRGFSRVEAAYYLGISETSIRELEKHGHITRHQLYGLTAEVFYKEDLDAYLDKSVLAAQLEVIESDHETQSERRGVSLPKGERRKVGRSRNREWPAKISYGKDKARGRQKAPKPQNLAG